MKKVKIKKKHHEHDAVKKKGFSHRGVRFRVWLYFVLHCFSMLTVLSLIQMFFYRNSFAALKENEINKAAQSIYGVYVNPSIPNESVRLMIEDVEKKHRLECITFFYATKVSDDGKKVSNKDDPKVKIFTDKERGVIDSTPDDLTLLSAYKKLESREYFLFPNEKNKIAGRHTFIMRMNVPKDFSTRKIPSNADITGVENVDLSQESEVYIYFEIGGLMSDDNTILLLTQLMISVTICIVLGMLISMMLSHNLSKPVTMLTESAQRLATGSLDVDFDAYGYGEYEQLAETLNFATNEIRSTERLRHDLIANVSHELRTPITLIKGYAEKIRDFTGEVPQKRNSDVKKILEEVDRLTALITDVLDSSRLSSGTEELNKTIFSLSGLVKEISTRFSGVFFSKGYEIWIKITPNCFVVADKRRIAQVVYNLISNALNYVGKDKIIIISVTKIDHAITFSVADHGDGIDPEHLKDIWERFYRSVEAKRAKVGTGIGLSLVKQICELHELEYGVQSEQGKGTKFFVVFDEVEEIEPRQ